MVLRHLIGQIEKVGETPTSLSRRIGRHPSYLQKVLAGHTRLRQDVLDVVLAELGVGSDQFWAGLESRPASLPATGEVRRAIRAVLDQHIEPATSSEPEDYSLDSREASSRRARILSELSKVLREKTSEGRRNVSLALGWTESYLTQVLTGRVALRVEHVLAILRFARVWPSDFFACVAERQPLPPLPRGEILPGLTFDRFRTVLEEELARAQDRARARRHSSSDSHEVQDAPTSRDRTSSA